ncbi:MAG: hypothetical protein FWC69_04845 [Defluviitaleaceae bacterium]|nr:hypothetical protein [Defluviitaleaceae bacterium]
MKGKKIHHVEDPEIRIIAQRLIKEFKRHRGYITHARPFVLLIFLTIKMR